MTLPSLPVLSTDASPDLEALWLYLAKIKDELDNGVPADMAAAVDVGGLGYSPLNALAYITLPTTPVAPGTPTGLTATPFYKEVGLSWDLDPNPAITGWQVQRADDAAFTLNVLTLTSARALSFLDKDLLPSTTYYYRIRAVGQGDLASSFSAVVSALTLSDTTTVLQQLQSAVLYLQRAHIGVAVIGAAQIDSAAIVSATIADGSITTAKIADAAITTAKIGLLAVTSANILDATITSAKIATLSADKLTAGTINVLVKLTNDRITLDGVAGTITILDQNNQVRALLGQLGVGPTDYGLTLFDSSGHVMWDAEAQGATNAGIQALAVNTTQLADLATATGKLADLAVETSKRSVLAAFASEGNTVPAGGALSLTFDHNLGVNPLVLCYVQSVSDPDARYRFLSVTNKNVTTSQFVVRLANSDVTDMTAVNVFVGFW